VVNGRWKAKFVEKGKPVNAIERFYGYLHPPKRAMALRRVPGLDYQVGSAGFFRARSGSRGGAESRGAEQRAASLHCLASDRLE
jgi:hypothetical protein